MQTLYLQDRLGRKASQGLHTLARCGLHIVTEIEKMNKGKARIIWIYFIWMTIIFHYAISTKHPLTPPMPQAICWVVQEDQAWIRQGFCLVVNKSQTCRKICFKQIGFLNWLLVNLIWLNDFGELIVSKLISCPIWTTNIRMSWMV